jgi:hypothetical protein
MARVFSVMVLPTLFTAFRLPRGAFFMEAQHPASGVSNCGHSCQTYCVEDIFCCKSIESIVVLSSIL